MTLDDLRRLVQSAAWFTKLGNADAASGIMPVAADQFRTLITASTGAEFGLPHDDRVFNERPFAGLEWLPTAHDDKDPVHGDSLAHAAGALHREQAFKAARLDIFRLALASQHDVADHPLLKIGPSDVNEVARMAGRFASRMAASEIVVDRAGFWCALVQLYHRGHWPFGRLPDGTILVL